ncbi:hypothetical protein CYMTET_56671 [Cymbomonas tetramitiformis]|uniref:Tyrosine-protein kinase ephrin type A/B receptor-like domain-containing protein n=1 Tax=Cymbomonas tetramitiformis TaxID=36881 RepID=A0AAE0BAU6_9CHLO|nr:hypothetical protein CYMTET_56671 [Cymbomonas tetramitiformis]
MCTNGTFSNSSLNAECAECPAGTYSDGGADGCLPCPEGTVAADAGSSACAACPEGAAASRSDGSSESETSALGATVCKCGRGHEMGQDDTGADACVVCSAGRYQDEPVSVECKTCPAGTKKANNTVEASDQPTDCVVCEEGTVALAGARECHACAANTTEVDRQQCECAEGTYTAYASEEAKLAAQALSQAPLHFGLGCIEPHCTCQACPEGQYAATRGLEQCTNCAAGTYNPFTGQISPESCMPCEVDTYASTAGSAECTACPQSSVSATPAEQCLCSPGYYVRVDAGLAAGFECVSCEPGTYASDLHQQACTPCNPGTYSNLYNRTSFMNCKACEPWHDGSDLRETVAPEAGSATCLVCPRTSDTDQSATYCSCLAGNFRSPFTSTVEGVANMTHAEAYAALAHEIHGAGAEAPDAALVEELSSELLGYTCDLCGAGHFNEALNVTACEACPAGTYSNLTGAEKLCECTLCSNNTVSNSSGATECLPCGENALVDVSLTYCYCPLGYRKVTTSAHHVSGGFDCERCEMGTFNSVGRSEYMNLPEAYECTPCPAGTYGAEDGGIGPGVCLDCEQLSTPSYSDTPGSSACSECPEFSFTYSSGTTCRCQNDYYATYMDMAEYVAGATGNTSMKKCLPCPEGGTCPGNDLIVGKKDYWRRNANQTTFYECNADICAAESATPSNATLEHLMPSCAEGHNTSVPMCGLCWSITDDDDALYLPDEEDLCQKCDEDTRSAWLRIVIAVLGVLVAGAVLYVMLLRPFGRELEERAVEYLRGRFPSLFDTFESGLEATGIFEEVYGVLTELHESVMELATGATLKTMVSFYQIASALVAVLNVSWPSSFSTTIKSLSFVNLDIFSIASVSCTIGEVKFYDQLLAATLLPVVFMLFIGTLYYVGWRVGKRRLSPEALKEFADKCHNSITFFLFLVYPSTSETIFKTFACVDIYGEEWLSAQLDERCWIGDHQWWVIYALVGTALVPVGVPLYFLYLLYSNQVPRLARYKVKSAMLIEVMEYCVRIHDMEFYRFDAVVVADQVPLWDLQRMYFKLRADEQDPVELVDELEDPTNPKTEEIRRRVTEVHDKQLKSRDWLIDNLLEWARQNGIQSQEVNWAEVEEEGRRRRRGRRLRAQHQSTPAIPKSAHLARSVSSRGFLKESTLGSRRRGNLQALARSKSSKAPQDDVAAENEEEEDFAEVAKLAAVQASQRCGILFISYRPEAWYFEVVELLRKLVFSGLLLFVDDGSITQIVFAACFAFVTLQLYVSIGPMQERVDQKYLEAVTQQVFVITFVAILLNLSAYTDSFFLDVLLFVSSMLALFYPFCLVCWGWGARVMATNLGTKIKLRAATTDFFHRRRMNSLVESEVDSTGRSRTGTFMMADYRLPSTRAKRLSSIAMAEEAPAVDVNIENGKELAETSQEELSSIAMAEEVPAVDVDIENGKELAETSQEELPSIAMAEEAPAVDVDIENGKELAETSQEEQSTNVVDSETSDVGLMIVEYIKEVEAMPPRLAKLQVAVSDLQHPGEASRIYDEEALPSSMYADEGAPAVEIEKLEKIDTFPRNEAVSTYFRSASLNPEDEMEEVPFSPASHISEMEPQGAISSPRALQSLLSGNDMVSPRATNSPGDSTTNVAL